MRVIRLVEDGAVYHVYCRGNNKMKIFHVGHDYGKYMRNLEKFKKQFMFKLYAYVLMPNHLHLLLQPKTGADLSRIMQALNISYSMWHNRRYECVGHVWQGRFQSKIIRADEDFLRCMVYIEENPVKARIVIDPRVYRWSSCYKRFTGNDQAILDMDLVYGDLGKTEKERRLAYGKLFGTGS